MLSALQNGRLSVRPSVPSIDSSSDGGGFAAEVGRGQQISIDTSAASRHAGSLNFGPTVRRFNINILVFYSGPAILLDACAMRCGVR